MFNRFINFWKKLNKKKFRIERVNVQRSEQHEENESTNRFSILHMNPTNSVLQKPDQAIGFQVVARTRPKQCPLCKTVNKITHLPTNRWQCDECKYTWDE